MSWLKSLKPKVTGADKKDVPDNLWAQCQHCSRVVFHKELAQALFVCPHCNYHMRINAATRVQQLADEGTWQPISLPKTADDPLEFKDKVPYTSRLKENREKTGHNEAFIAGECEIDGQQVVLGALDFTFIGGSMGAGMGEGIITAVYHAVSKRLPLVIVSQKGGKNVHAWAFEGNCNPTALKSNTFTIEWPPHSGRMREFPEVDRAEFFGMEEAKKKINPAQVKLLLELERQKGSLFLAHD